MTFFDAVAHAFAVVALGGFSTQNASVSIYAAVTQWVLLVFMLLAGINFLRLYRLLVQRHGRAVARDEELRLYLALMAAASVLLVAEVVGGSFLEGEEAVRASVFQAVSTGDDDRVRDGRLHGRGARSRR